MNENIKENRNSFPLLSLGQLLVLANIFINAFVKGQINIQWLNYVAAVLLGLALVLWPFPIFALRKHGEINSNGSFLATTKLVDHGIYSKVRHPQYLGMILLNTALLLLNPHWIIILTSLASSVMLVMGAKEEEKDLTDQFGQQYIDYIQRVSAFNPFSTLFQKRTSKRINKE